MTQVYVNAINLVLKRIHQCGLAIGQVSDQYSLLYWQLQLAKAKFLKMRIEKRLKMGHNVIRVDFQAKRKVA